MATFWRPFFWPVPFLPFLVDRSVVPVQAFCPIREGNEGGRLCGHSLASVKRQAAGIHRAMHARRIVILLSTDQRQARQLRP